MDSDRSASSSFGTELTRFLRFYFGLFCVFLGYILISFWEKKKKNIVNREGGEQNPGKIKFDGHLRRHKSQLREVEGARVRQVGKEWLTLDREVGWQGPCSEACLTPFFAVCLSS